MAKSDLPPYLKVNLGEILTEQPFVAGHHTQRKAPLMPTDNQAADQITRRRDALEVATAAVTMLIPPTNRDALDSEAITIRLADFILTGNHPDRTAPEDTE